MAGHFACFRCGAVRPSRSPLLCRMVFPQRAPQTMGLSFLPPPFGPQTQESGRNIAAVWGGGVGEGAVNSVPFTCTERANPSSRADIIKFSHNLLSNTRASAVFVATVKIFQLYKKIVKPNKLFFFFSFEANKKRCRIGFIRAKHFARLVRKFFFFLCR